MSTEDFSWQDYLAPKYWPSWLGLGSMRILAILPYRTQLFIGRRLGDLFARLSPYRREIVQTNIRLCFPELSASEQQKLIRDHFHSIGISIAETALAWWASDKKLRKMLTVKGYEHIEKALKDKTGAILLGAHYTTTEIAGRMLNIDHKLAVSYQKMRNPIFNHMTLKGREKCMDRVFGRDEIRATFRYIKQNHLMWIAVDQDAGIENSLFIPFFGTQAASQTVASRMAKVTKAPVIPYISRRLDNARGYVIEFLPPLENFPGDSLEEDTLRTNQILEKFIRQAPEQYLWVHRRFKTRPEGEPKLYRKKPRRARRYKK